jgi:hypothetical protein
MIKKLLLAVAIIGAATYSQAQGYVYFDNGADGVKAKIYDVDGITALTGNGYYAQIYAADGPTTDATKLTAKGTPVNFYTSTKNAGYVLVGDGTDGAVNSTVLVTDSTAASTLVTIQVRAWSADTATTTYDTASKSGKSTLFQVTALASTDANGNGQMPNGLTGLTSFNLTPEPTTIALGALGLSVLLFRRRK